MKPTRKRALERERQEKEREDYKLLVLEAWHQADRDDRRKVIDLKTAVQIKARRKL